MSKEIIVKLTTKYHPTVEGENVEGISYVDQSTGKLCHDILGFEVTNYEKVENIPDDYEVYNNEDFPLDTLYDAEGVNCVYEQCFEDVKHSVSSKSIYFRQDEENSETDNIEYRIFDIDSYSKFCYLFGKENRLFYLTY